MSITKKELIGEYVKAIREENAAVFAGSGLSIPSGFVNWKELLREIAENIGLDVDKENDLIALAQYFQNERNNRGKLNQLLIEEFSRKAVITDNHLLLASMPIKYYWTTNYDNVIENAINNAGKTCDTKISIQNLATTRMKTDAIIYKMHGDSSQVHEAILTKDDYETFEEKRSLFSLVLKGDILTKTFLFLGYSFNDPNLQYILSRIRILLGKDQRPHYCIMRKVKKEDFLDHLGSSEDKEKAFQYAVKQQTHRINDLKRYSIYALLIDDYNEITQILQEIQLLVRRNTIFISGAAEIYKPWDEQIALNFIRRLCNDISAEGYKIITGFGHGIGSSVINGVLDQVKTAQYRNLDDYLIMRPFPQPASRERKDIYLKRWSEYRQLMISQAGVSIFVFGNKKEQNKVVDSNGMIEEFEISIRNNVIPLPIGCTGYVAGRLWELVSKDLKKYFPDRYVPKALYNELNVQIRNAESIIAVILKILKIINKY